MVPGQQGELGREGNTTHMEKVNTYNTTRLNITVSYAIDSSHILCSWILSLQYNAKMGHSKLSKRDHLKTQKKEGVH